jgi:DNA-binding MarR family transcriptional regulator
MDERNEEILIKSIRRSEIKRNMMILLKKKGALSFTTIANELKIPKTTLQRHVKSLEKIGLIKSSPSVLNKRLKYYQLTQKGQKVVEKLI